MAAKTTIATPTTGDSARAGALEKPLPLRVGLVGPEASRLFGGGVTAVPMAGESPPGDLQALLIDAHGPGVSPADVGSLVREAGSEVAVIALARDPADSAPEAADLVIGARPVAARDRTATPSLPATAPIDPRLYNPLGFHDADAAGFAALVTHGAAGDELASGLMMLAEAVGDEPLAVLAHQEAELAQLPRGARRGRLPSDGGILKALQPRLGVLDHPGFHRSEWERAGWIVKLCAGGVPVVAAEISPELGELLGPELAGVLERCGPRELADPDRRERISVALRRAALRHHSQEARWRQIAAAVGIALPPRPLVSVIFATRREEWLEHGLAQVNRQSYEPRELVVCLHGDAFEPGIEERVRGYAEGPLKIERVDAELTLGDALNQGVAAAAGELVTKMDDDDYYNVDHLWDLVLALEYSGADLVGKAAEFVYLEEVDVLVRQLTHDVDTRLAGGGMMIRREALVELGGWPARTRGEDLAIIRLFNERGRAIHRIPPHGYILNRHGRDHTWGPQVDYFLFRSQDQWRGLRLDVTAIEPAAADLRPGR